MALSKIKTNSLSDDAVTAAKIATGTIVAADLAANSVDSSELVAGSVDTAHIAADNIVASLIADNAIDSEHYTDGSIDTAHIANLQITTALIAADAIDGTKLADNAVDSEHYTDGSIDTAHIANDQITAALIADNAIDSDMYVDGSIDTAHIANDQITAALMADNSIDSDMYVDGSIDTAHIANDQITAALIADNAIDSDMYVDGSIDLAHMSSESVDEDNLYISNAGSNGQALTKQSGNNGGLTWATIDASLTGIDDQSSSNDDQLTITDTAVVINEDSDDLDFRVESNGNANMLIVNGGTDRVGIGEDTPLALLHVRQADMGPGTRAANNPDGYGLIVENSANSGISIWSGNGNNGHVLFGDDGYTDIGRIVYRHADNSMAFDTNTVERMRLNAAGTVMIGASTMNDIGSYPGQFGTKGDTSGNWMWRCEQTGGTAPYGIVVSYSGCAPDNNDNYLLLLGDNVEATRMRVTSDGDCQNHDNSYGAVSDERLKTNIVDAQSQWDDIKGLKVRNFSFKSDVRVKGDIASNKRLGLIAQEAELVSPGLVKESPPTESEITTVGAELGTLLTQEDVDTGNYGQKGVGQVKSVADNIKAVNYSILYMKAIKCLQEAQTRIETLETKVAVLEG